jgi:hypothetical protein
MIGEESMLWSAIFLDVLRSSEVVPALLSPAPVAAPIAATGTVADGEAETIAA